MIRVAGEGKVRSESAGFATSEQGGIEANRLDRVFTSVNGIIYIDVVVVLGLLRL